MKWAKPTANLISPWNSWKGVPSANGDPLHGNALDQVERYGIQLADALSHAHSRGIIHRDLKAANVMVTPVGIAESSGLWNFTPHRATAAATKPRDSINPGSRNTPLPERFPTSRRKSLKARKPTSEATSGRLVFCCTKWWPGGGRFTAPLLTNWARPSCANAAPEITQPIPMVLQSVIDKCLNKDPGQRYQSAGEVRAALETAGTASRTQKFLTVVDAGSRDSGPEKHLAALCRGSTGCWSWATGCTGAQESRKPVPVPGAIQSIAVLPLENLSGDPRRNILRTE